MNRRNFLLSSMSAVGTGFPLSVASSPKLSGAPPAAADALVAVLLVDTDRATTPIDERIYGHFLEHINHSVEDGLFAEQIRGAGFEGSDFKTYWEPSSRAEKSNSLISIFRTGRRASVCMWRAVAQESGRDV